MLLFFKSHSPRLIDFIKINTRAHGVKSFKSNKIYYFDHIRRITIRQPPQSMKHWSNESLEVVVLWTSPKTRVQVILNLRDCKFYETMVSIQSGAQSQGAIKRWRKDSNNNA